MQIDFEFGLSQLSGNEALLIKLLAKIRAEYTDCEAKLTAQFDSGQWEDAKVLIHTLKGVSGNLGCTALHQICKVIDTELKYDNAVPASFAEFTSVLSATLGIIETVEQTGTLQSAQTTECGTVAEEARQELIGLLNDNAFVPPDVLSRVMQTIALNEHDKSLLEQHINTLNYPSALELLKA